MNVSRIRISKVLSNCGVCSRRAAEKLVIEGRVKVNDSVINTPLSFVKDSDRIAVDGSIILRNTPIRLWKYFKPRGVITSHKDNFGRSTLFEMLPKHIGRVISVGRLDYNTEGLILLTNNGDLARMLELPSTRLKRVYLCKAYGKMPNNMIDRLLQGVTVSGVKYAPAVVTVKRKCHTNTWYKLILEEGKNNEIRNIFNYFNLQVSRLIRVSYGEFTVSNMKAKDLVEVNSQFLARC